MVRRFLSSLDDPGARRGGSAAAAPINVGAASRVGATTIVMTVAAETISRRAGPPRKLMRIASCESSEGKRHLGTHARNAAYETLARKITNVNLLTYSSTMC